jgi:oxygen-independent coproporphyrinogen-3 oxidase
MPSVYVAPPVRRPSIRLTALPPLALYVHVPWCVRKCPYCDFNSHELRISSPHGGAATASASTNLDEDLESRYIDALIADLDRAVPGIWGRSVHAIFIGGGTPSLLSVRALETLLGAIRARLRIDPGAEITLEANPGAMEADKFAGFRAAGVNRLSLGVQSFHPGHLRTLGRVHDAAQARRAIETARDHFENFNLDLMYALPGQTVEQALADVDEALAFGPSHLSAYHLTIEPNTYFHRHPPALPDNDTAADMQEAIEQRLAAHAFQHYETSAFAQPGCRSRHNLNYWTFGDYLGIGAGAHGKLSFPDRIVREMRWKHPREYLERAAAGDALHSTHEVSPEDLPFEFMMNALRLIDGVSLRLFVERTGLPLAAVLPRLDEAQRRGWLLRDHGSLRPTLQGQRFLNDLLQLFLR